MIKVNTNLYPFFFFRNNTSYSVNVECQESDNKNEGHNILQHVDKPV